jgi:pyrroloquinoline quinone (PQQ) biosynthesis protein C
LATEVMVAFAYDYINRINPMGFFGMVYVLESTSVMLASAGASAVQKSLGLPPAAFRYLTSHGALDQEHMTFFENLMAKVTLEADRNAILHVAKCMFVLFGDVFRSIPHQTEAANAA